MISIVSTLTVALFLASTAVASQAPMREARSTATSQVPFSGNFHQPQPPSVKSEFRANWNQHKWNQDVSHIASGYLYNSFSQQKVRVDEAYDSTLGSSFFDFANVTEDGVSNVQWLISPSITSTPSIWSGFVSLPNFPIVSGDFLITSKAVFAGTTTDQYAGQLTNWNILYGNTVPANVLVDDYGIIHGWDYWSPNERTYVITRLFNIVAGHIDKQIFTFPDPQ